MSAVAYALLHDDAEAIALVAGRQELLREADRRRSVRALSGCDALDRLLEAEERDLGRVLRLAHDKADGLEDLDEPRVRHELGVAETQERDHEEEEAAGLEVRVAELEHLAAAHGVWDTVEDLRQRRQHSVALWCMDERTYHTGDEDLELARGREVEEVALLDALVARVEVNGAHVEPRTREELRVDRADLVAQECVRADDRLPIKQSEARTSSTRSGGALAFGRRSNLVRSWKTHLDVLWKLVDKMLQLCACE